MTALQSCTRIPMRLQAVLEEAGYKDVDGDGYREMPDGSEMNVLVTPQYNHDQRLRCISVCLRS